VRYLSSQIRSRGGTVLEKKGVLEKHNQQVGHCLAAADDCLEGERDACEGVTHAEDQGYHVCERPRVEAGILILFIVKELALNEVQLVLTLITVRLEISKRIQYMKEVLPYQDLTNAQWKTIWFFD